MVDLNSWITDQTNLEKQCLQLRRTVLLVLPLSESPVNTDKTETWSSANILDTSFPMVDLKLCLFV